VKSWRSLLGFQERLGRLRELLETFTSSTLTLRVEVAPGPPARGLIVGDAADVRSVPRRPLGA
jgi:hypothetical protein